MVACVRAPPPPPPAPQPPPPPPIVVPDGCLADLSGEYVHELDERYRYRVADGDAGVVVLTFFDQPADAGKTPRRFSRERDGGLPWLVATPDAGSESPTPDAGPLPRATLLFSRTSAGFVGGSFTLDAGCRFPATITACAPSLVIETPLALNIDCSPLDAGWSQQRLHRVDAGSDTLRHEAPGDAGEPDGGEERAAPAP